MAFEYGTSAHTRARKRRVERRQRLLLGLQAAALLMVAVGVLLVSRPPADERPSAREVLGRALRVLDARPSGVVVHQVVTESGLGQDWPQWLAETATDASFKANGQFITLTGSGFKPNGKVLVAFNAPYDANGAPIARDTAHIKRVEVYGPGLAAPTHPNLSWAFDAAGNLYSTPVDVVVTGWTGTSTNTADGVLPGAMRQYVAKPISNIFIPQADVVVRSLVLPHPSRIESWRQLDSGGTVTRAVLTARDDRGALLRQVVINDGSVAIYDSTGSTRDGAVVDGYRRAPQFWLPDQGRGFVATPALQAARGAVTAMQQDPHTRLLGERRLDGHDVFVLVRPDAVLPGFSPQAHEEDRLYIDAGSYQVRGYESFALQRGLQPHLLYSVRVPLDETVEQGDVPVGTYRFTPPAGAQETAPRCSDLPMSAATAAYGGVTPLLPPGHDGLTLQLLSSVQTPAGATTTYLYQQGISSSQSLEVDVLHGSATDPIKGSVRPAAAAPAQPLSLMVAGRRVRGTLIRANAWSDQYTFRYATGDATIAITGTGFARPHFMRTLAALVDTRSGALLAQVQRDLIAAQHAGAASGC